jgi:preprotein translocase subunit YajC
MGLLIIIVAFGAMYFLMIRPQQQQRRMHEELVASLVVGDEVLTSAGLYGTITGFEGENDEVMRLEIAPDVVISMNRTSAIEVAVEDLADDAGDPDGTGDGD